MSKAKFPNTTRRRLTSSVVCRLSSSGAAFFFPRFFFHDLSLHSDKRPPKQGPYSCCSRPMIGLRGLWLGAMRGLWPVQPMKTWGLWPMTTLRGLWPEAVTPRGLWPMIALRSLWLGGAARPVAGAADDDASVGPITEGAKPVAGAAGPITEGAKRRMSQSSLSACLHRRRFSLALIVALRLIVSGSILART